MDLDARRQIHERIKTWQEDFSLEHECAPYRGMTEAERARIVVAVCRDVVAVLRARPDSQRVVEWQEEMPAESVAVWERLRREHAHARG